MSTLELTRTATGSTMHKLDLITMPIFDQGEPSQPSLTPGPVVMAQAAEAVAHRAAKAKEEGHGACLNCHKQPAKDIGHGKPLFCSKGCRTKYIGGMNRFADKMTKTRIDGDDASMFQ